MTPAASALFVIVLAVVAANLPFVNHRLLLVGPRREPKPFSWRLLEWALLAGGVLAVGVALETQLGQRAPQGWGFYAAWVCLFAVFGFPGFVWRYLRRR